MYEVALICQSKCQIMFGSSVLAGQHLPLARGHFLISLAWIDKEELAKQ
jgi:hypothetical protein